MPVSTNQIVSGISGFTSAETASLQTLVAGGGIGSQMVIYRNNVDNAIATDGTATDTSGRTFSSYTFTLPGGALGPKGRLRMELLVTAQFPAGGATPANDAIFTLRIGSTQIIAPCTVTWSSGATRQGRFDVLFENLTETTNRFLPSLALNGVTSLTLTATTIDTTVDQTVNLVGYLASGALTGITMTVRSLTISAEYGT